MVVNSFAFAGIAAFAPAITAQTPAADAIRAFKIDVPQPALDDLRRRIAATRWPDRETVADQSQGVQLELESELCVGEGMLGAAAARADEGLPGRTVDHPYPETRRKP